jgi:magnesium-transporting ATPase (P-type)
MWVKRAKWTAYVACGWAFLFAALSFFWAAGGRTGLHPLEQQATSNRTTWIAINLIAGALKVIIGLVALALVRSQGRSTYRRLLFVAAWALGVGMILYGGLGLVSDVLHVTGIISSGPETRRWFFWYLVLWDPWWVLGGVLYMATAWLTRRRDAEIGADRSTSDKAANEGTELSKRNPV